MDIFWGWGAWSSSGAAGGGAWTSSERPVPPAWPSRTPYKSVPQKSGSESWKSTSTAGAGGGGAWTSTKTGAAGRRSMVIFWGCGLRGAWSSSERPVPPAWPSRTPYKSVPQKSGSESWKSTSTAGAGGGGAWTSTKTGGGGAWTSSGLLGGGACHKNHLVMEVHIYRAAGEHGHLLGLRVEEHGHLLSDPCRLLGHHMTPYKSVPQRSEPESWKPTKTNEQSSHRVSFELSSRTTSKSKPAPYRHVEPSPTPEVRQVTAFPSVWSPSTA